MTQPEVTQTGATIAGTPAAAATVISLSLEEEILVAAELLTYENPNDGSLLSPEARKESLDEAREAFLEIRGRVRKVDWPNIKPYEVGKDLPTDANYLVRAIFGLLRDDLPVAFALGDMRVYCEPKQSLPGDSFRCITLNRVNPAVIHEPLTRDTYAFEIGKELLKLQELEEIDDEDEDEAECPSCHAEVDEDDAFCASCGKELPEGDPAQE
jgi:hypothetical protein